jgi:ADP-ribosyl-[dinitrogen reductase] hydrolase
MQSKETLDRAQGCLMGQLAGDALGSLVEFQSPEAILRAYPHGVRKMVHGGTWDTLAGQPTDDSEMALLLARMLVKQGAYVPEQAREAYLFWLRSNPFDCGATTSAGLKGFPNDMSQANGALMRISPLGIFGANYNRQQVGEWARQDAAITHPNLICQHVNSLFAMAISHAIKTNPSPLDLYQTIATWADEQAVDPALLKVIREAAEAPPADYVSHQGWVLIAFHNALWQLFRAPNLEEGVVDTIMRGGDTDTNAAICGALLGAVYGLDAIPIQWVTAVLGCRPKIGTAGVYRPRPECFWPVDALELAERLV